jgi:hypothetical protein
MYLDTFRGWIYPSTPALELLLTFWSITMKRYIFSLLVGSCLVVWSVLSVNADWEFTKWGMSPEQVVQASNRQARLSQDEIPSVLLTQDWQSGRFLFVVSYLFDEGARGQGLTKIQLQLKNGELRKELLADLKNKYGSQGVLVGHTGRIQVTTSII